MSEIKNKRNQVDERGRNDEYRANVEKVDGSGETGIRQLRE